jgi:hypothetical protein
MKMLAQIHDSQQHFLVNLMTETRFSHVSYEKKLILMFELKKKSRFIDNVIGSGLKAHQTFSLGQWLTEHDHQTPN